MTIRFVSYHELYSITSFPMKKWVTILLKTTCLKKTKHKQKKGSHVFFPRPLIFKFQQDVLKINDICVSWSLPRTDREMNFLNLEIEALRKSVFLNRNYLSKYLTLSLLINLFIYYTDFRNIQLNEHVEIYDGNYLSKYLTFLHLLTYLFFN